MIKVLLYLLKLDMLIIDPKSSMNNKRLLLPPGVKHFVPFRITFHNLVACQTDIETNILSQKEESNY